VTDRSRRPPPSAFNVRRLQYFSTRLECVADGQTEERQTDIISIDSMFIDRLSQSLATERSRLLDPDYGTVFHRT